MRNATFYDSDGGTPIPGKELPELLGGSTDTPFKLGIRNTGDEAWPSTWQARIKATGLNDGASQLRIGLDTGTLSPPTGLGAVLSATGAGGVWAAVALVGAVVTALNGAGETVASGEVSVSLDDPTKVITWTWAAVPGASGYRLYRTLAPGTYSGATLIAAPAGSGSVTVEDDGSAATAGVPPAANTTGGAAPTYGVSGTLSRNPVLLGAVPPGGWAFLWIGRVAPAAADARYNPRLAAIEFVE